MTFERSHTSSLLIALPQLRDVKEPGLCSLVKGGREYEVARKKDPEVVTRRTGVGTLDLLLYPGCVPFVDEQALAGGHIPPGKPLFSTSVIGGQEYQFLTS